MYEIVELKTMKKVSLEDIVGKEIVFFGETHGVDWIIDLESKLIKAKNKLGELSFVGLEFFNYRMDELINSWIQDKITWNQLVSEYSMGREGFSLNKYRSVLEAIKEIGVRVVGVMPPREDANKIAKMGLDAIEDIEDIPMTKKDILEEYEGYKNTLLYMFPKEGPMAKLNPINLYYAQALKDQVIAERVAEAYKEYGPGIVITGYAHIDFYGSATTRFRKITNKNCFAVSARNMTREEALNSLKRYKGKLEITHLAYKIQF